MILLFFALLLLCFFVESFSYEFNTNKIPLSDLERCYKNTRNHLQKIGIMYACSLPLLKPSMAASTNEDQFSPLFMRYTSNDAVSYSPGITTNDIYFPAWIDGKWQITSTLVDVDAPLGEELFGGSTVLDQVKQSINKDVLSYAAKFRKSLNGEVLCDRLYNVEQIAIASMGERSVVDDSQPDFDLARKLHIVLAPPSSKGRMFSVDLITRDRIQFQASSDTFDVLEKSSQIIMPLGDPSAVALQKDIETITLFSKVSSDEIAAVQRTATFLSSRDPRYELAFVRNRRVDNTAVDVRKYVLTYKRI